MTNSERAKPAVARNAPATRDRILKSARRYFSQRSYENVGVREICSTAGVDAALVSHYFGSKERLFAEAIDGAFHVEKHLPESFDTLGEYLVREVMGEDEDDGATSIQMRLLLLAMSSPNTASVASERFHAEFVQPLAKKLRGRDSELRAALIGSYVIGLAAMRHLLGSPTLASASNRRVITLMGDAIQACVTAA